MKRKLFVVVLGIFTTTGLCADTPPPRATDPPPPEQAGRSVSLSMQFFSATMGRLNKKGEIVLKLQMTQSIPVTATRVLREGKEVEEKHTFYEWVTRWEDKSYDPKDIKLLGSDGKPLDKKVLPELLKKERPVLYTYDEDKIDGPILKVIKEGTPILILPRYGPPVPGEPS